MCLDRSNQNWPEDFTVTIPESEYIVALGRLDSFQLESPAWNPTFVERILRAADESLSIHPAK